MERLIDGLEQLKLRLACGCTPASASVSMPDVEVDTTIAAEWKPLREQVLEGRIGAEAAISGFLVRLRLADESRRLVARKTLNARMQGWASAATALFFLMAALVLFPAELRPGGWILMLSLAGIALGTWWMHRMQTGFERRLWYGSWIASLARWGSLLRTGNTTPAALDLMELDGQTQLPNLLRARLAEFREACRTSRDMADWPITDDTLEAELRNALEQLVWLRRLFEDGHPMAASLETFARDGMERFRDRIERHAEALSMKCLLPLFFCYLPSFLLLLFGPLLALLA